MDSDSQDRLNRRRRNNPLTASRIIETAIMILDADGEEALTARSLARALTTGAGAIYNHVGSKQQILAAAAAQLVTRAVSAEPRSVDAASNLRQLMLTLFDVIDEHPWVGAQLTDQPGQPALLEMFESIGQHLDALRTSEAQRFHAASALMNYVLGVASQYAAAARRARQTDRGTFLADIASDWRSGQRASTHPFAYRNAPQLAEHDERQQYLAGVNFLLIGILNAPPSTGDPVPSDPTI
ncbi:TetR/AcrR family transcriptional regulator [Actinoplanes sp. URMC 104]|uniref:TetR/AcrR family transcriptional regulator n=1 Tax=Actinoplanes sp. URMC 104 TaxID=3423409 RepID=UPI003F1993A1